MGQLKWYKRDPDAALSGMMGLSLEERGAYNTVLDLLYSRDGALPDDARFISGWLGTDVRVWRRIRDSLIAQGKLAVVDGLITNSRASLEIDSALSRLQSAREAGHASARTRRHKSNNQAIDSNDLAGTNAPTKTQRTVRLSTATATVTTTDSDASASLGAREFVLPADAFLQFRQHRTAMRKPMTSRAEQLIVMTLERIHREHGHDPTAVLDQSILRGWAGVFPLKEECNGRFNRNGSGAGDKRSGLARELDRRMGHG
jgi:uncharacterized protein YdaU (DUF1376 family)